MAAIDTSEFDLVADRPVVLSEQDFKRIQYLLLEFQPARRVRLVNESELRLRVLGFGGPEVASGLLAEVETIAGSPFHVEVRRAGDP